MNASSRKYKPSSRRHSDHHLIFHSAPIRCNSDNDSNVISDLSQIFNHTIVGVYTTDIETMISTLFCLQFKTTLRLLFGNKCLPGLIIIEDTNFGNFSLRLVNIFHVLMRLIFWCTIYTGHIRLIKKRALMHL